MRLDRLRRDQPVHRLALARGDAAAAVVYCEEGLALFLALEDGWDTVLALDGLARAVLARGDRERAGALWRDALDRAEATGARDCLASILEGLAALAVADEPDRAARLLGAAAALRDTLGTPLPPTERTAHDRTLTALRAALVLQRGNG